MSATDDATGDGGNDQEDTPDTGTGRVHDWGYGGKFNRTNTEAEEDDELPGVAWEKVNSHGDVVRFGLTEQMYEEGWVPDTERKYSGIFIPKTVTSAESVSVDEGHAMLVTTDETREGIRQSMIQALRDNFAPDDLGYDGPDYDSDEEEDDGPAIPREAMKARLKQRTKRYKGGYDPEEHEKKDLYTIAQDYDIEGRSGLDKMPLIEAILDAKEEEVREEQD